MVIPRAVLAAVFILVWLSGLASSACYEPLLAAAFRSQVEVSPEETPEIRQVQPDQAGPGEELTVGIDGRNFSAGAYVSFSSAWVRVLSTRRISATRLEAQLAVNPKAKPGAVSLFISNPASTVAEVPFTVLAKTTPTSAPASPPAETQTSKTGTPEVSSVEPPRVAPGSQVTLRIKGKNFARGVKVAFSNPGIQVLETAAPKATELKARLVVADDAPIGRTNLFVVNPDDSEVEVPFEVADKNPATSQASAKESFASKSTALTPLRFEVLNLGEAVTVLQDPSKAKGTLAFEGGKLKYEEGNKEIFSVKPDEVKEIDVNTVLGVNTGTFHVILNSGKMFNFIAASLRFSESQSMVESLRRACH